MSETIVKLEPHPYADIFPAPNEQETTFVQLEADLIANGMFTPITLYHGKTLDGRRRYLAYTLNPDKIELKTIDFVGTDKEALAYSLSLNNERRQLGIGQRALAALRLASFKDGSIAERQKAVAEIFHIDVTNVKFASFINTHPALEKTILLNAIDRDELPISVAYKIAKELQPEQWRDAIKDEGSKAKTLIKQVKRKDLENKLSNAVIAETREKQNDGEESVYGVIYIDIPWTFEVRSENGMDRSEQNHYPTMTLDDIRAMEIPAATNCAMFMWATTPHLANAIEILEGWGFDYKTCYVWDKIVPGLGYITRNQVEILLYGTKGTIPAPTPDMMMPQLISVTKTKHSEKPEVFADAITKMFPNTPKLEMFARRNERKGNWFFHGNQSGIEVETITQETPAKRKSGRKSKAKAETETAEEQESAPQ